jgi:hypothetical protein
MLLCRLPIIPLSWRGVNARKSAEEKDCTDSDEETKPEGAEPDQQCGRAS